MSFDIRLKLNYVFDQDCLIKYKEIVLQFCSSLQFCRLQLQHAVLLEMLVQSPPAWPRRSLSEAAMRTPDAEASATAAIIQRTAYNQISYNLYNEYSQIQFTLTLRNNYIPFIIHNENTRTIRMERFFQRVQYQNGNTDFVTGRVISVKGFKYHLMLEPVKLRRNYQGKLLFGTDHELLPKVGDWVFCLKYDTIGYITEVYPTD